MTDKTESYKKSRLISNNTLAMAVNAGFTLIELSVVLVIIGLIIGGILTGTDLIASSTIRAQVAQIEGYRSAVKQFESKYDALPGDINPSKAAKFGFTTRSGADHHGDEDGRLYGCSASDAIGCETSLFWSDLSKAKMIKESFTAASDALEVAANADEVTNYIPEGKLDGTYIMVNYTNSSGGGGYATLNTNVFHLMFMDDIILGNPTTHPWVKPQDAYSIDLKMDDGKPHSGSVVSSPGNVPSPPANGVCVTDEPGNPYNTSTSTFANYGSCYMKIFF